MFTTLMTTTLVLSAVAGSDTKIEDAVVGEAVLVMSVDNLGRAMSFAKDNGICEALYSAISAVKGEEALDEACGEMSAMWNELLAEAGLDESPDCPSGYAGFAAYPVVDHESGEVSPGLLAMIEIDAGDWGSVVETLIERGQEQSTWESETVEISGEDVWVLSGHDWSEPLEYFGGGSGGRFYAVLEDGFLLVGTDADGIARGLAVVDGDAEPGSLSENEDYQAVMERLGDDGDVRAVIMLENFVDALMQPGANHMMAMALPMVKAAIGDIDAIGNIVNFDPSDDTLLESRYTVWMRDGRDGLLGLIGEGGSNGDVPSFVGSSTISFGSVEFEFDKVSDWLSDFIGSQPMLQMQAGPQMDAALGMIKMATDPLGERTAVVTTLRQPIAADSLSYLLAVECDDQPAFEAFLNLMAPGLGTEPRDFLGFRVFSFDLGGGMMPGLPTPPGVDMTMSLAVAGNWVFLGNTPAIEDALRIIANPDEASRSHGPDEAVGLLPSGNAAGWGYGDFMETLAAQVEINQMQMTQMLSEMEEFDPEMADEMREEFGNQFNALPIDALMKIFGPTSWTLQSDDNGFTSQGFILRRK
jgi:hypothetical protein